MLKTVDGVPVFLSQVADVLTGGEIRAGLATADGKGEAVVGMILKLIGMNTSEVIGSVQQRMAEVNKMLPEGVKAVAYYDQATLVAKCVHTVIKALGEATVLVVMIQLLMMGGLRPSVVVLAAIPFSLAFAFHLMKYFGISANLMSLGGLAIALGLLVDGSVVLVENVDRVLRESAPGEPRVHLVARGCVEVARPIVFSLLIILTVFLPLLTLQGVEGKTFRPLAQTMACAMFGSLIFAMTLAPVLASFLMRQKRQAPGDATEPKEFIVLRMLWWVYRPVVSFFVRWPALPIVLAVALIGAGGFLISRLGSEFVPRLNEGDLLIRATMAPSISIDEARDTMLRFERRLLARFPESPASSHESGVAKSERTPTP